MALRRELHRRGLRYRIHLAVVPGTRREVDIVFPRLRVAVDIRGCFWHACPDHGLTPKHNAEWWALKLSRNVARDRETEQLLTDNAWLYLVVWEHEDPLVAADRVMTAVASRHAD